MGLRTAYRTASQGIRIPYQRVGMGNRGFLDLRGRVEDVAAIAEAAASPALRTILVLLATTGSPLFSLGCDLGSHEEPRAPPNARQVAGGYLHVVAAAYASTQASAYRALADTMKAKLAERVGGASWAAAFLLQDVEMRLDADVATRCASLSVTFFAAAASQTAATASREALLDACADVLMNFQLPPPAHG